MLPPQAPNGTPAPRTRNRLLAGAILLLVIAPFFLRPGAKFAGADDSAHDLIATLRPGFKPWAQPPWTPPGGEVQSLLFAVQAALGGGYIGYYFGRKHGHRDALSVPSCESEQ